MQIFWSWDIPARENMSLERWTMSLYSLQMYVKAWCDPYMGLKEWSTSLRAVALTMFVFGLLVWLYTVVIQVTHPEWLSAPLAHYDVPPFNWRIDDLGMIAFAIAALGFFMWRLDTETRCNRT